MLTSIRRLAAATALAITSQVAFAAQYQVTVQADFTKDTFASSVFGITGSAPVPIQASFIVNGDGVITVPAGTTIANGASFPAAIELVPRTAITNFVLIVGNQTFSSDDLQLNQVALVSALFYDVLLVGPLSNGSVTGVQFTLSPASGSAYLEFGSTQCAPTGCSATDYGNGIDFIELSIGAITNISVSVQNLTPAPTPTEVIATLLTDVSHSTSLQLGTKNALTTHLSIANKAIAKGNVNQALNSLRAFSAVIEAMIKVGKISAQEGQALLDAAQIAIAAM